MYTFPDLGVSPLLHRIVENSFCFSYLVPISSCPRSPLYPAFDKNMLDEANRR